MANIKSIPCRDFLYLMGKGEYPNYTKNLKIVIDSFEKRGIKIDQEKLEKEIDLYM